MHWRKVTRWTSRKAVILGVFIHEDIGQAKDLTIPVRVHGPYDKIAYDIRWSEVSSEALKGLAAPKIEEQKKVIQEKAQEQIKGKLQGLFNQ